MEKYEKKTVHLEEELSFIERKGHFNIGIIV